MNEDDISGALIHRDIRDHVVYRLSLYTTIADRNGKIFFYDRFGVTLREYRILGVIGYAEPISLMDLSEECYLDKGQISRVVAKLVADGFVARTHDNDISARGGLLQLTKKGRALLEAALAYGDQLNDKALSVLSATERRLFSDCLNKLLSRARAMHDEAHL